MSQTEYTYSETM